jgi:hypothetical protein
LRAAGLPSNKRYNHQPIHTKTIWPSATNDTTINHNDITINQNDMAISQNHVAISQIDNWPSANPARPPAKQHGYQPK